MFQLFIDLPAWFQALIATIFTWAVTALGASLVFFVKDPNERKLFDGILGFAAGVMVAASFFSLILPAIELSGDSWIPASLGVLFGAIFLYALDKAVPHLHPEKPIAKAEGPKTNWHRSVLLVSAITLHNIPEGLAIGVAFGAASLGMESATFGGAIALALGIGIQNFPEGTAVAMPLRRDGLSRKKCFFWGQLSGAVEPLSAVLGALLVIVFQAILPYALAFAAGAMLFVVVEELIPESQTNGNSDIATGGFILGFIVMMILDVALS